MSEGWRWFEPSDPVSFGDAREARARGIVTGLHQVADDRARPAEEVADAGLLKVGSRSRDGITIRIGPCRP